MKNLDQHVRARQPQDMFGHMVQIAMAAGLEAYHSDLYHDANALRQMYDADAVRESPVAIARGLWRPARVIWAVREAGTHLMVWPAEDITPDEIEKKAAEFWRGAYDALACYIGETKPLSQDANADLHDRLEINLHRARKEA